MNGGPCLVIFPDEKFEKLEITEEQLLNDKILMKNYKENFNKFKLKAFN